MLRDNLRRENVKISISRLLLIVALLSLSASAQTTIVEYTKNERASFSLADSYRASDTVLCLNGGWVPCNTPSLEVVHLDKFDSLEAAMQFMADHQDYKLVHFYSALVAVDVKVEEKKTSEPQPPIEKTEKIYKFGSITKKKVQGGTAGSFTWINTNLGDVRVRQ
jgi:hypothetical protein